MTEKMYTLGQIAKKYRVPLSKVYAWAEKVRKIYGAWGRVSGIVPIPHDPYERHGFPESLVDLFPNLPILKEKDNNQE